MTNTVLVGIFALWRSLRCLFSVDILIFHLVWGLCRICKSSIIVFSYLVAAEVVLFSAVISVFLPWSLFGCVSGEQYLEGVPEGVCSSIICRLHQTRCIAQDVHASLIRFLLPDAFGQVYDAVAVPAEKEPGRWETLPPFGLEYRVPAAGHHLGSPFCHDVSMPINLIKFRGSGTLALFVRLLSVSDIEYLG